MLRLKRLRKNPALRDLVAQANLSPSNLVMPYFIREGKNIRQPIPAMPGICRLSQDELLKDAEEIKKSGLNSIILFGLPKNKYDNGLSAYQESGVIQKAIAALKKNFADELAVITDVCLCGYTTHGHCGIIKSSRPPSLPCRLASRRSPRGARLAALASRRSPRGARLAAKPREAEGSRGKPREAEGSRGQAGVVRIRNTVYGTIDNEATLEVLAKVALSHARAGADIVAPSAMMDGQVGSIRESLDKNGFEDTAIMGYSAKFASNFYGPFRDAADSAMKFGDRKGYQMDYRNSDEALREIEADIREGADMVMVKPALAYLDIIARAKERFNIPLAAFNVSGEYAMVKAYAQGAERELALEILTSIKRAGADIIITYWAKEAAKWLR